MNQGSQYVVHRCWTIALGNEEALRQAADDCRKMDANIVADYVAKTGMDEKACKALMDAETFLNADEALDKGLVDEIANGTENAAKDDDEGMEARQAKLRMMRDFAAVIAARTS